MRLPSRLLMILPSAKDYRGAGKSWRADLTAGLTVGIVALPLALAFGISSGAGAAAGLITAIVAGVVAAIFGGSHVQVSGPTGAMVVVLAPVVAVHGVGAVPVISLMAGLLVLLAGLVRLGRVVAYIPLPVVEGFTVGIAVTIFVQQIPTALGSRGHDPNAFKAALESIQSAVLTTTLWSVGAVLLVAAIMVLAPRIHRKLPGSVIAIVIVTAIAGLVPTSLARIGTLPSMLVVPGLPSMNWPVLASLVGPAAAVAALAAIESLLSARVAASMADNGEFDADRELVGQGLASIASGLFGGMPATGAIARTALNVKSGARSRLASIAHSLVLLLIVLFGSAAVAHVPMAALAGVLMITATRMVSASTLRLMLSAGRSEVTVFLATAAITMVFDLIVAVGIGILTAAFFALRALSLAAGAHRETPTGEVMPGDDQIAVFRLDGSLYFGAAERLADQIAAVSDVSVIILRMSGLQLFDATGARVLADLVTLLERRGITVLIKGIRPEHQKMADRMGVVSSLRHREHVFDELDAAIAHARSHLLVPTKPIG